MQTDILSYQPGGACIQIHANTYKKISQLINWNIIRSVSISETSLEEHDMGMLGCSENSLELIELSSINKVSLV